MAARVFTTIATLGVLVALAAAGYRDWPPLTDSPTWSYNVSNSVANLYAFEDSPLLFLLQSYFELPNGTDPFNFTLTALEMQHGTVAWKITLPFNSDVNTGAMSLIDGVLFYGTMSTAYSPQVPPTVLAINVTTGRVQYTLTVPFTNSNTAMIQAPVRALPDDGTAFAILGNVVLRFHVAAGKRLNWFQWTKDNTTKLSTVVAAADGMVLLQMRHEYLFTPYTNYSLLRPTAGGRFESVWSTSFSNGPSFDDVMTDPVSNHNGTAFFTSSGPALLRIDMSTGGIAWNTSDFVFISDTEPAGISYSAATDAVIGAGEMQSVFAVYPSSGTVLWKISTPFLEPSTPTWTSSSSIGYFTATMMTMPPSGVVCALQLSMGEPLGCFYNMSEFAQVVVPQQPLHDATQRIGVYNGTPGESLVLGYHLTAFQP